MVNLSVCKKDYTELHKNRYQKTFQSITRESAELYTTTCYSCEHCGQELDIIQRSGIVPVDLFFRLRAGRNEQQRNVMLLAESEDMNILQQKSKSTDGSVLNYYLCLCILGREGAG